MRIAIFGSIAQLDYKKRDQRQDFIEACKALGAALARAQQSIVTLGGGERFADIYVVEGFLEVAKAMGRGFIHRIDPGDRPNPLKKVMQAHARFFTESPPGNATGWSHAVLRAIEFADAVVTVGGSDGTFEAAGIALATRKTLVPIGSFSGASKQLLSERIKAATEEETEAWRKLGLPWSQSVCQTVLDRLRIGRKPRVVIIHGRSDDWRDLKDSLQNQLALPEPIVMQQRLSVGKALPEKWETLAGQGDAAIALVTPDDVGRLVDQVSLGSWRRQGKTRSPKTGKLEPRARQNVWLEVGFIWGRLGREGFLLLVRGAVASPSDLQGLEYHPYKETPIERVDEYRRFIEGIAAKFA